MGGGDFPQQTAIPKEDPTLWTIVERITNEILASVPGWAIFIILSMCALIIAVKGWSRR